MEQLAQTHLRAWLDLATSAAAVVNLPARTLHSLTGLGPAPVPTLEERLEASQRELVALRQQAEDDRAALAAVRERAEADHTALAARLEARALEAAARASEHEALVAELRRSYAALEREVETRVGQAQDDQKRMIYGVLEPLLTQLPLVRRSVDEGKPVEAGDVLALLAPLDELAARLGLQAIGAVGAEVTFDPARHQMAAGAPPEGAVAVWVKHIGFELDGRILRKARVHRRP